MAGLTNRTIETTKPLDKEYLLADGNGLYLRVRPSGAKSWVFKYRRPLDGRNDKVTIGSIDDYSLKVARQKARDFRLMLDEGKDPKGAKAAERHKNAKAISMQALFDAWMEHSALGGTVSASWLKRYRDRWSRYLTKPLGNILVKDLHRAHLAGALDAMTHKGIKEETRKVLSLLNMMLDYGVKRHYLDVNPARLLKPKDFAASAGSPRERALHLPELRGLWLALEQAKEIKEGLPSSAALSPLTVAAVKLLILTGARRGEVVGLRWSELDLAAGIWDVPKERTKNRRGHRIYLNNLAIQVLNELKPITGHSEFVLESLDRPGQHIHKDSLTKALGRLRQGPERKADRQKHPLSKVAPFTLHDLRRSAATCWGEHLKVAPHVIELMLNHLPKDKLVATYQRASYAEEQRAAWLAWGEMVERFVAQDPENVISIGSRKGGKKRG